MHRGSILALCSCGLWSQLVSSSDCYLDLFLILNSVFVKLNKNENKYWDGDAVYLELTLLNEWPFFISMIIVTVEFTFLRDRVEPAEGVVAPKSSWQPQILSSTIIFFLQDFSRPQYSSSKIRLVQNICPRKFVSLTIFHLSSKDLCISPSFKVWHKPVD